MEFLQLLQYSKVDPLLFNSVLFTALFSFFYVIYVIVNGNVKIRNLVLLVFSLFFYYKIAGEAVIILIFIAISDFIIGKGIAGTISQARKSILVTISVLIDLGVLGYFKYAGFFIGLFDSTILKIAAPVGISYYIFKTMSYTLGLYREEMEEAENSFLNYFTYVAFFPNIIAGPISLARDLIPQLKEKIILTEKDISTAIFLLATGFFKKLVIADFIAVNMVDRVYDAPSVYTSIDKFFAAYGAVIQIYFDFSGYTDIVLGLALLMGFRLENNFNMPFVSKTISEFWRRWHITLYAWLKNYLFDPLTLRFRTLGTSGIVLAVMITFLLSGLWHGAALTFIIWGLIHGTAICFDIFTRKSGEKLSKKIPGWLFGFAQAFITFHIVAVSFVFFKSPDTSTALEILNGAFTVDFSLFGKWYAVYSAPFIMMITGFLLQFIPSGFGEKVIELSEKVNWVFKAAAFAVIVIIIYQVVGTQQVPFIYLEF